MFNPLTAEIHRIVQKVMIMFFFEQIVTVFRMNCNQNKVNCFCRLSSIQTLKNKGVGVYEKSILNFSSI